MYITEKIIKNDLEKGYDVNIYISDRNGRKSSAVQLFLIHEAIKNKSPTVLVRSKIDEEISKNWLSEYVVSYLNAKKIEIIEEKYNNYIKILFLKKGTKKYPFIFGLYVSVAKKYKSNYIKGFEKVKYLVWEECIPTISQIQKISYCKAHYFEELKNVLSIGSTVARSKQIQYIFLGNDISNNIVNSITVGFNLLERIRINVPIEDIAEIDGKEYSFKFIYFDYPQAVNHWINMPEFDVSQDVNIENSKKFSYLVFTQFKKYYIYDCKDYLYLSPKALNSDIECSILTEKQFFDAHNALHLLDIYNLPTALKVLQILFCVPNSEISKYYGENWYFDKSPKFKKIVKYNEQSIINISELNSINKAQFYALSNYQDVLEFKKLITDYNVIYDNIGIKFECENFLNKFLLID